MRSAPLSLLLALLLACAPAPSRAAAPAQPLGGLAAAEPGAELRVYLMTLSPGSIIYERFGHNTLVVHDPTPSAERVEQRRTYDSDFYARYGGYPRGQEPFLPTDRAHHYGAFDFEQPGFVPRFVMGRMEYWTASEWADLTALSYGLENRAVLLQELNLSPAQKRELQEFLEWNERPENRAYRYDYYRDNCSTRVRDAIDRVTGGALKRQLGATQTETTFRSHTRRLTSGLDPMDLFWFTGFTYVLGHPVDMPLSAWDECFLPDRLSEHVRNVTITDSSGATRPLVRNEQLLATTTRMPMPEREPRRLVGYLLAGLVVGGGYVGLARAAGRSRLARWAFALLVIPWALVWGVGALIAANGWAFTDHAASYRNENLLQATPLVLPLAVLAPMLAFGRRRGGRLALILAAAGAGVSVLGLLLKVLPAFWQHNGETIALLLPANIGLALALYVLARRASVIGKRPVPQAAAAEDTKGRR